MLTLANKLSIARILLVPLFVATILYYTPQNDYLRLMAIGILLIAMFSDALDGYIARIKGERTKLGALLDPLADKLLMISAFICLAMVKTLPAELKLAPWIVIIVISRDVIIVLGSGVVYLLNGKLDISPTVLGKITTTLQMLTLLTLLFKLRIFFPIMYAMIVFSVLSGLDYIRIGSRLFGEINNTK